MKIKGFVWNEDFVSFLTKAIGPPNEAADIKKSSRFNRLSHSIEYNSGFLKMMEN